MHVSIDDTGSTSGGDPTEQTPFGIGGDGVINNLGVGSNGGVTFEYLGGCGVGSLGTPVVHGGCGNEGQIGGGGPLPKDDWRVDIVTLEFGFGIQVEHLDHFTGAEGEDVHGGVH